MNVRAAEAPLVRSRVLDWLELLKLRLNFMVMLAVAAGHTLGSPTFDDPLAFLVLLLGVLGAAGGASAINMALEAPRDRLMQRTRWRPVAAGRLSPEEAWMFGGLSAALGILLVALAGGPLPAALTAATVVLYVGVYTPLKTRTCLNTLVGAVPGALPPLIGWTAAGGALDRNSLTLFALVFVWQFPHFLAIASIYREDYARGGFAMLPVRDRDGSATAWWVALSGLLFVPVSLLPATLGPAGPTYLGGAALLSGFYLICSVRAARQGRLDSWRTLLRSSLVTLPALFALMMIDRPSG